MRNLMVVLALDLLMLLMAVAFGYAAILEDKAVPLAERLDARLTEAERVRAAAGLGDPLPTEEEVDGASPEAVLRRVSERAEKIDEFEAGRGVDARQGMEDRQKALRRAAARLAQSCPDARLPTPPVLPADTSWSATIAWRVGLDRYAAELRAAEVTCSEHPDAEDEGWRASEDDVEDVVTVARRALDAQRKWLLQNPGCGTGITEAPREPAPNPDWEHAMTFVREVRTYVSAIRDREKGCVETVIPATDFPFLRNKAEPVFSGDTLVRALEAIRSNLEARFERGDLIRVTGHADWDLPYGETSDEFNVELSRDRANFLAEKMKEWAAGKGYRGCDSPGPACDYVIFVEGRGSQDCKRPNPGDPSDLVEYHKLECRKVTYLLEKGGARKEAR